MECIHEGFCEDYAAAYNSACDLCTHGPVKAAIIFDGALYQANEPIIKTIDKSGMIGFAGFRRAKDEVSGEE